MKRIIFTAGVISALAFVGRAPEFVIAAGIPMLLAMGAALTVAMIYALARD